MRLRAGRLQRLPEGDGHAQSVYEMEPPVTELRAARYKQCADRVAHPYSYARVVHVVSTFHFK